MMLAQATHGLPWALSRLGLRLVHSAPDSSIPGSFWGAPEAGIVSNRLFVRDDTPLHSALHEACHFVCMTEERRQRLHTDAGGDDAEEAAVCYLQIGIADQLPGIGAERLCADMDAWGYSFRLGSAWEWYRHDAADARLLLIHWGVLSMADRPTWRCRR